MAVVNDAVNPDSSKLEGRKKRKKKRSNMFLFPPGQKHTYFSPSDTANPHGIVARLLFVCWVPAPSLSISVTPSGAGVIPGERR